MANSITASATPTEVIHPLGQGIGYITDFTFVDNYVTDGIVPTFGAAYKSQTKPVMILIAPRDGYMFDWDYTNGKIVVYSAANTQITGAAGFPAAITASPVTGFVWFHKG